MATWKFETKTGDQFTNRQELSFPKTHIHELQLTGEKISIRHGLTSDGNTSRVQINIHRGKTARVFDFLSTPSGVKR